MNKLFLSLFIVMIFSCMPEYKLTQKVTHFDFNKDYEGILLIKNGTYYHFICIDMDEVDKENYTIKNMSHINFITSLSEGFLVNYNSLGKIVKYNEFGLESSNKTIYKAVPVKINFGVLHLDWPYFGPCYYQFGSFDSPNLVKQYLQDNELKIRWIEPLYEKAPVSKKVLEESFDDDVRIFNSK